MKKIYAHIKDISIHLPQKILSNDELAELYSDWPAQKIFEKTGILERRIAAENETAGDLAYHAAKNLFDQGNISPENIDYIILCTQAPDYVLPTTACILQERLNIPRNAGALDINLGCSGFVYGLSLAKGLIETGSARCVLFLTADTYSKYINPMDNSVRTLFGDGAAATVICASETEHQSIGPFIFGTDGRGAKNLIVEGGSFRNSKLQNSDSTNSRDCNNLYMNGAEIVSFALQEVPKAVDNLLNVTGLKKSDIDYYVLHQANKFMLETLRKKMKIEEEKLPIMMSECGNTVSSTLPITLFKMKKNNLLQSGNTLVLVGFGVGYSWAACLLKWH